LGRRVFSTTIDEETLQEFRVACTIERKNMNDVLEEFMRDYAKQVEEKRKPK